MELSGRASPGHWSRRRLSPAETIGDGHAHSHRVTCWDGHSQTCVDSVDRPPPPSPLRSDHRPTTDHDHPRVELLDSVTRPNGQLEHAGHSARRTVQIDGQRAVAGRDSLRRRPISIVPEEGRRVRCNSIQSPGKRVRRPGHRLEPGSAQDVERCLLVEPSNDPASVVDRGIHANRVECDAHAGRLLHDCHTDFGTEST